MEPLTIKEIILFNLNDMVENKELAIDNDELGLMDKIKDMPEEKLRNFYIQNNKDKFYYKESIRIKGVDSVLADQKIYIFTVEKKFPYITGIQKVVNKLKKDFSAVRQAIKETKDVDNALTIIAKIVKEQAVDQKFVNMLETALHRSLVTEV